MNNIETMKLALEALIWANKEINEWMDDQGLGPIDHPKIMSAITALLQAIEQAQQAEPVAWMCADESLINKGYARFSHVCMGDWKIPVYTSPSPRQPLTAAQAGALWKVGMTPHDFAQAIEAAHGIKEKNNV